MAADPFSRRRFMKMLTAGLVAISSVAQISCRSFSKKPNILLILSDDAGFADFGFQGSQDIPTPNIDKLAENGIVFTDAHTTSTVCSPSRAGIMTGRYQQRFGHEANVPPPGHGMDPDELTLAQALNALNYKTAIFGKWHLGQGEKFHPNNRGFDEFYGLLGGSRSYFPSKKQDQPGKPQAVMHNDKYVTFKGYFTDVLGEKTVEFIEENKDRPFFIYLSFTAVHTPMQAKKEHLQMFKNHPRPTLAAMTWSMDENVGKVIKALEENDLLDNTLIFFTNDNGGSPFNHSSNVPLKGWKGNKFEGGQRVPFIVQWKDHLKGGRKFSGLTSTLDIFPTAFEIAGGSGSPGKPLDGVNLLPFLQGEKKGDPHQVLFWRKEQEAAVRYGDWKLIRLQDYGYVLYNLKENIGETKNLIEKNPQIFEKMKKLLEEWEAQMKPPAWHESKPWRDVTWQIHKDLMENRIPKKLHP